MSGFLFLCVQPAIYAGRDIPSQSRHVAGGEEIVMSDMSCVEGPASQKQLAPARSFVFMILEHYIYDCMHDPAAAKKKLMDVEGIKEFADAGYVTLTDEEAEKIRTAGLIWVRAAIESPLNAEEYREVANSMLEIFYGPN